MRPHLFILHILCLTLLLLQACSPSPQHRALDRAESLLDSHPDSALIILDSIDCSTSLAGDDRMLAMLLRVQANDKCYVTQSSDSTIRQLLAYYIDGGQAKGTIAYRREKLGIKIFDNKMELDVIDDIIRQL